MEEKNNILSTISLGMGGSWLLIDHLNVIIAFLTIVVCVTAIVANIARTRRENSKRRIDEYDHLNKEIRNHEQK